MRGLAIAAVFLYHCYGAAYASGRLPWGNWLPQVSLGHGQVTYSLLSFLSLGHLGVALFFVVSGFCIHLSLGRSGQGFGAFYTRRFFRIVPPYVVVLLVFAMLQPGKQIDFFQEQDRWQFLSHLLLFHNLDDRWLFGINPSFWSIAVEVQLYLLYPFLLMLVARSSWRMALAFVAGIELGLRLVSAWSLMTQGVELQHWLMHSPLAFGFSWSLGAWLADAHLKGEPLRCGRIWIWLSLTLACMILKPLSTFAFPAAAMATAVMLARMLEGTWRGMRLPTWLGAHLSRAGVLSYSFYLVHQPLVLAMANGLRGAYNLHSLLIFAVCMLSWLPILWLSRWSYQYLELPSVEWGKLWLRTRRSSAPAAVA